MHSPATVNYKEDKDGLFLEVRNVGLARLLVVIIHHLDIALATHNDGTFVVDLGGDQIKYSLNLSLEQTG